MPIQHLAAAALLSSVVAGPAMAAAPTPHPPPPRLSIAVDDGRSTTQPGDRLTYTVRVRNLGTVTVRGLTVTQTLPPGLTLSSADRDGAVHDGVLTWFVDLGPGATVTLTSVGQVASTAPPVPRLASIVCARPRPAGVPLVCAADSDRLPGPALGDPADRSPTRLWWYVAGVALLGLALAGYRVIRRRRRSAEVAPDAVGGGPRPGAHRAPPRARSTDAAGTGVRRGE